MIRMRGRAMAVVSLAGWVRVDVALIAISPSEAEPRISRMYTDSQFKINLAEHVLIRVHPCDPWCKLIAPLPPADGGRFRLRPGKRRPRRYWSHGRRCAPGGAWPRIAIARAPPSPG